jgi:hypothetical protein
MGRRFSKPALVPFSAVCVQRRLQSRLIHFGAGRARKTSNGMSSCLSTGVKNSGNKSTPSEWNVHSKSVPIFIDLSMNYCPREMRRLFETVRKLVEKRYQRTESQDSRELPWQSVSAFCFLRFIVPAILHPHLFGLCPGKCPDFEHLLATLNDFTQGLPPAPVSRSLTLIAKVIQSMANLNAVSNQVSQSYSPYVSTRRYIRRSSCVVSWTFSKRAVLQ